MDTTRVDGARTVRDVPRRRGSLSSIKDDPSEMNPRRWEALVERACGGHDEEILSCNIDEAWTNLKIDYNRFDFETEPLPQTQAYFKWLKAQLAAEPVSGRP